MEHLSRAEPRWKKLRCTGTETSAEVAAWWWTAMHLFIQEEMGAEALKLQKGQGDST